MVLTSATISLRFQCHMILVLYEQHFECGSVSEHGHFPVQFALLTLNAIENAANVVKDAFKVLLQCHDIGPHGRRRCQ